MPLDPSLFPRIGEMLDVPILARDIRSFRGGMVNKIHPTSLNLDEAVLLQNVLLKEGALAQKRAGSTNVMDAVITPTGNICGLGYWNPSSTSASRRMLAASQGGVYDWDGSNDWRLLTGGNFTGSEKVHFVQGVHTDPTFLQRMWMIQKGASFVYEYNGNQTLSVVSGASAGLAGSVPTGSSAIFWLGRLWVAEDGERNGYISYSEFGKPTTFPSDNAFLVDPNDEVTRIVEWFNAGIIVFQRNSIHALDIDQANFLDPLFDSSRIETLNMGIGCVAGSTVSQFGQDFLFLSRDGVMKLSKTARDRTIGQAIPVSDPIEETIQRINWNAVSVARGVTWNNLYMLAVPVDNSDVNNLVLVWDIRESAWTTIDGWDVGDFQVAHFNVDLEDKLYFGTSVVAGSGEVYEAFDANATDDNGTEIATTIQTPRYDFGTTDRTKIFRYIDLFTDASSGGTLEVYAAPDNQDFVLLETFDLTEGQLTLPFFLPPVGNPVLGGALLQRNRVNLDQFGSVREIQFQFKMTGAGASRLLYFTHAGQPDEQTWS